jgi:hypothetical protein
VEDKNGYGPYVWYNQTNDPAWYWQSESQLKGSSFQGIMNQYDGSGFVQVLSSNQSATINILNNIRKLKFKKRILKCRIIILTLTTMWLSMKICQEPWRMRST